jgi:hypothetical protein
MNDENWFNWLTGRRGTLFGDMKHEHEQRMAPTSSNFGSGGRTSQGEGITPEGFFSFVAACFAMYYIRKVGVVWEWYWWVGAFLGTLGVVQLSLTLFPIITKFLSIATVGLIIWFFVMVCLK